MRVDKVYEVDNVTIPRFINPINPINLINLINKKIMANQKLSEVEHIKDKSDYLRGTLVQSLDNRITGALYPDDTNLIKFHGSYQQTDRDLDTERKAQKLEPLYSFMIRVRVPGGIATPAQWLRMDDLADRYGNGTLKLTTRQAFQLHGIRKRHLKTVVRGFNEVWLDSIAGCGDVNRNVMCSPNPDESRIHAALSEVARELSAAFTPQTTSYYEIWLDGEPVDASQPFSTQKTAGKDEEPVYGKTYLPRKFKIALAVPPQNDTDVFANDIGLIAIGQDGELAGFNVVAGGGLGMTFGQPETFPRLADPLGYIDKQDVVKICEAIITTQRDHGNRENRRLSRLKYTVERLGLAAFKQEIESRSGVVFQPEQPYRFEHSGDPLGWTQTHDGRFHLTLFIEGGRMADQPDFPAENGASGGSHHPRRGFSADGQSKPGDREYFARKTTRHRGCSGKIRSIGGHVQAYGASSKFHCLRCPEHLLPGFCRSRALPALAD